jgi:hypothetical protein
MALGNFTDIPGFNTARRREHPVLRAFVAAGLFGAVLCAVWVVEPYVAGALLTVVP